MPDTAQLPPPEQLNALGLEHLDALERAFADELGLELEGAVIVACVKAPDADAMEHYTMAFHAVGDRLEALEPDARAALAFSCREASSSLLERA